MDELPERNELLEARLAKCTALPPEQRSPEVAAFIETAELQAEVAELLAGRPPRSAAARGQRSLLASLKITRAHCINPVQATLLYRPAALRAAYDSLAELLPCQPASAAGASAMSALLQRDSSLETLLRVAAGVRVYNVQGDAEEGMVQMGNAVVHLLQQPAEAARVREELAAAQAQLPRPMLTFEQLLAFFVATTQQHASTLLDLLHSPGTSSAVTNSIIKACQNSATLLPLLEPQHCCHQFIAAMSIIFMPGTTYGGMNRQLLAVMQRAEQRGCDLAASMAGYQLITHLDTWVRTDLPSLEAAYKPSDALACLARARDAHRRAVALLPSQWTAGLGRRKAGATHFKPWLIQLQQAGERWAPIDAAQREAAASTTRTALARLAERPEAPILCAACGRPSPQLKQCGACRRVSYCSHHCQRVHWPQHRGDCRGATAARAQRQQAAD